MLRLVPTAGILGAILFAACLLLVLAGCGDDAPKPGEPESHATPSKSAPMPAADDLFEDVTAKSGIRFCHHVGDGEMSDVVESVGSGAACFDYDGDGFMDLYLVQFAPRPGVKVPNPPAKPHADRFFRNRGDGTFEDVTEKAGLGATDFGFSAAAADYDNDGDQDLFVFNEGRNRLYRNRGDGTFEDISDRVGFKGPACTVAGTLLDFDGDGWLDLYEANYLTWDPDYTLHYSPDAFPGPLAFTAQDDVLYRNLGDGTFEDVTAKMGLDIVPGRAMGVGAADFDGDGKTDVFVANDASANFLLKNLGGGKFDEIGLAAGVAYGFHGEATGSMAPSIGDFDDDGLPDMHVTDTRYGSLYHNRGKGRFQDKSYGAGIAAISGQWASWGGGFFDFDNDGDQDIYIANGDLHHPTGRPDLLFENTGKGKFTDASRRGGPYFRERHLSRGACLGDYDNDGGVDVLVTNIGGKPVLLHNRRVSGHHWIKLQLQAVHGVRDAWGAQVTLRAGGRTWIRAVHHPCGYLTQPDPRLHFGLGTIDAIEDVHVRWPGTGTEERFGSLAVDRIHRLVEGEGAR